MSTEYTPRRFRSMPRGPLGSTYGASGSAPYGPGVSQGWTGSPQARGVRTLAGFRSAPGRHGYAMMPYAPAPVAAGASYGAPQATEGGRRAAGGAASAGVGLTTTLIGAAAAGSAVPVAGWIVAGGLVATAGVVLLVDAFRRKGVQAAKQVALQQGYPLAFAKEYGKMSAAKLSTAQRREGKWIRKIEAERKDVRKARDRMNDKPNSKSRRKKYEKQKRQLQEDIDRLNAVKVVIGLKTTQPTQPTIAGMRSTVPEQVEERGVVGDAIEWAKSDTGLVILGSLTAATFVYGGVRTARKRKRS